MCLLWPIVSLHAQEKINFSSEDGLMVTADHYAPAVQNASYVVLFHQAGWSRGEYREIAPKLISLGFGVVAVDQRSGGKVNGIDNETYAAALKKNAKVDYIDALPDMLSAIEYVDQIYKPRKLIVWGSSYSAALVLHIAGEKLRKIDAVLSFSPGEYFTGSGKPGDWVKQSAQKIDIPVFITSARSEIRVWDDIFKVIPVADKAGFVPKGAGQHGARTLWSKFPDHQEYWQAVEHFLKNLSVS
ncbi:hypothetical protein WH96_09615 [Kiloniella spongiae]|uniref:Serine aminopeptidase S33 domain-containing protein n=1 Tax=Kiloniella spongiae TaxID=1489064 RepID=A0A0H2MET1_9PROT|nr:hypothetical protein WH96_09615 [Kiloniella spongiae]